MPAVRRRGIAHGKGVEATMIAFEFGVVKRGRQGARRGAEMARNHAIITATATDNKAVAKENAA